MTPPDAIFHEPVEVYLARLATGTLPHPVFEQMHEEASRRNFPIVGPEVGRFFLQLAAIHRPTRILELGSGFGYSGLWWAFGHPNAEIHLTEFKQSNLDIARAYATTAGRTHQFHYHAGDALRTARALPGTWDIIFADIDKNEYPAVVDFAEERLRADGLLLFDNMLWRGQVALPEEDWDPQTEAIVVTTRRLYNEGGWHTSLIPLRDGVLLAVRDEA